MRLKDYISRSLVPTRLLLTCLLYLSTSVHGDKPTVSETVGQIVNSLRNVVGSLKDFVGDKDGCTFQCPNGYKPKQRRNHVPSSNGCGSFGFNLEKYVKLPGVTGCCDKHDVCYDTCLNDKDDCDKKFKKCLQKVCKSAKKILTEDMYNGCKSAVDLIYASTVALGCKPYKEAQQNACQCKSRTEL